MTDPATPPASPAEPRRNLARRDRTEDWDMRAATPPASPAEPKDPLRIPPMHEVYNFARSNPQTFADIVYEVEVEWGREAMHGRLADIARERDELQRLYVIVGNGRDEAEQRAEAAEKALREIADRYPPSYTDAEGLLDEVDWMQSHARAHLAKHTGGDNG